MARAISAGGVWSAPERDAVNRVLLEQERILTPLPRAYAIEHSKVGPALCEQCGRHHAGLSDASDLFAGTGWTRFRQAVSALCGADKRAVEAITEAMPPSSRANVNQRWFLVLANWFGPTALVRIKARTGNGGRCFRPGWRVFLLPPKSPRCCVFAPENRGGWTRNCVTPPDPRRASPAPTARSAGAASWLLPPERALQPDPGRPG